MRKLRSDLAFGFLVAVVLGVAWWAGGGGLRVDAVGACSPTTASTDSEEQAFFGLLNTYRQQNGLGTLALSPTLDRAAAWMAEDLATHSYFSHTSSDGRSPSQRAQDCGYPQAVGENLAAGLATAQQAFDAWRASPGHNAQMLGTAAVAVGIGRAYGAGSLYGWYWATEFGTVLDGPVPQPTDTPQPTSTPRPTNTPTSTSTPMATPTPVAITATPTPLPPNCRYAPELGPGAVACDGGDTEENPGWTVVEYQTPIPYRCFASNRASDQ